jgi:MFS family permease
VGGAPIVRSLVGTSGAVMLVAGATNVAELVIAQRDLGAGSTGFALLVSAFGCGMLAGSLLGARDDEGVTRRYLTAIALLALGLLGTGAAPALPLAMLAFALAGVAPSACRTPSTRGASAPPSWPAARSPPASAAARRSCSPARSRWSSSLPPPTPSARRGRPSRSVVPRGIGRSRRGP